jgi:hypothetical protein
MKPLARLFAIAALLAASLAHADPPPLPPMPPMPPLAPLPPMPPVDAQPRSSTQLTVKGPVTLRADVIGVEIEVFAGAANTVKAQLGDSSSGVKLTEHGDRVEVSFERKQRWPHVPPNIDGKLRVELPPGSHVELSTVSGDVRVQDVGGDVRVRAVSGDVYIRRARRVEVQLVSGDAKLEEVSGEVQLRTVSGDAVVTQVGGPGSKLEFGTTSGDLLWTGACAAGCRIETRSCSGDVKLMMAPNPSFDLRYVTHSGDLTDDLNMSVLESQPHGRGNVHARLGSGVGLVECESFSGDVHLTHH